MVTQTNKGTRDNTAKNKARESGSIGDSINQTFPKYTKIFILSVKIESSHQENHQFQQVGLGQQPCH